MSNEMTGIKFLFNPVTDIILSFRLQGQLGLGEDKIPISAPCLLYDSQLSAVMQIQAGDSYSATITGETRIWYKRAPLTYHNNCIINISFLKFPNCNCHCG